jgi:hypothetical protein
MLFNSFHFFAFFPIVLIGYFLLPFRWRNLWLLGSSLYFYGSWKLSYLASNSIESKTGAIQFNANNEIGTAGLNESQFLDAKHVCLPEAEIYSRSLAGFVQSKAAKP